MRKVAPSVLVREELDQLLRGGAAPGGNIVSELVSTVTRLVVQELLEAEKNRLPGRPRPLRAARRGGRRDAQRL